MLKEVGTVIHFDTHWEDPHGKHAGTIVGYDIHQSKYKVAKHSFDGKPMLSVIEWIFVRDGRTEHFKKGKCSCGKKVMENSLLCQDCYLDECYTQAGMFGALD